MERSGDAHRRIILSLLVKEIRRSRRQHLGGLVTRGGGLSHSGTAEADSSPMASASGRGRLHSLTLLFLMSRSTLVWSKLGVLRRLMCLVPDSHGLGLCVRRPPPGTHAHSIVLD